jgi:hypothetical protein
MSNDHPWKWILELPSHRPFHIKKEHSKLRKTKPSYLHFRIVIEPLSLSISLYVFRALLILSLLSLYVLIYKASSSLLFLLDI